MFTFLIVKLRFLVVEYILHVPQSVMKHNGMGDKTWTDGWCGKVCVYEDLPAVCVYHMCDQIHAHIILPSHVHLNSLHLAFHTLAMVTLI